MTKVIETTLVCDNCGKSISFIGNINFVVEEAPRRWYKLTRNEDSVWNTSDDFSIFGDFCSLICVRNFIDKKLNDNRGV